MIFQFRLCVADQAGVIRLGVTTISQNKRKEKKNRVTDLRVLNEKTKNLDSPLHTNSNPRTSGDLPESVLAPTDRRLRAAPPGSATDFSGQVMLWYCGSHPLRDGNGQLQPGRSIPILKMARFSTLHLFWHQHSQKLHVTVSAAPGLSKPLEPAIEPLTQVHLVLLER